MSSTESPVPDKNSESSEESSATDYGPPRPGEHPLAWAKRNQNAPPYRPPPDPTPRGERKGHGGPIRVYERDGVLTPLGKRVEQERLAKLEQERLAKLAAGEDDA